MPLRALKPCARVGCRALTRERWCPACKTLAAREDVQRRGTSAQRGYGDAAWQRCRALFLSKYPRCIWCGAPATEVDHIVSVRQAPGLRLHWSNLRAACKPCHSRRTATEQGFARGGRR